MLWGKFVSAMINASEIAYGIFLCNIFKAYVNTFF